MVKSHILELKRWKLLVVGFTLSCVVLQPLLDFYVIVEVLTVLSSMSTLALPCLILISGVLHTSLALPVRSFFGFFCAWPFSSRLRRLCYLAIGHSDLRLWFTIWWGHRNNKKRSGIQYSPLTALVIG